MGTWSEDHLKSLRAQYNFEKRNTPNSAPEVPSECELDSRGVLQWKGGKRPIVHSGYYGLPHRGAKDRRARLHRALDAVLARDAFQVTAVGMKKVAEAKRRDFLLMAHNSETEAANLTREGNIERAKKFLAQEAKWRAMAARSDEEIYREYKAQH